MGFGVQLDRILKHMPKQRQTLMFSATLPQGIQKLSAKYLDNPERISMGATNVIASNIKQEVIRIEQDKKYEELLRQLENRGGTVIVFIKTKYNAEKMAKKLRRDEHKAEALHGDLRQNKRNSVMQGFRNKKFRILVATDIAARGLDVPHIEHVINYDLPQVAEDYIHRLGRTARAGEAGSALCFVASQDSRKWHAIEVLLDPSKKTAAPKSGDKRKGRRRRTGGGSLDKMDWGDKPDGEEGANAGRGRKKFRRSGGAKKHRGQRDAKRSAKKGGKPGEQALPPRIKPRNKNKRAA